MKRKEIENEYAVMWIENGVMFSKFKKTVVVDIEQMKLLIQLREEISAGENQYWMYDLTNLKTVTKEARDYADIFGQNYLNAVAVIVDSHITKFIYNSYMKLKKPLKPCKVFKDREKAFKWLLCTMESDGL